MKRYLVFWIVALVLMSYSPAQAGTPYDIHWVRTVSDPKCETAELGRNNGTAFFQVNETPLPTYNLPGSLMTHADGSQSAVADAGFDSVLLRVGSNAFSFGVWNSTGSDLCVQSREIVTLVSASLGIEKPLFNVRREGTAYFGISPVSLSLSEINPPLARDIVNLEAEIAAERKWLLENASKAAGLAARLDLLQQLDTELHDLVSRPLDEISEVDLDAILDRYEGVVDEATRASLEQLLADLKKSVQDLKDELSSLLDQFGAQADAVADLVTQGAEAAGFTPDDPFGYSLGPGDVPWVEIPDVSGVSGAFDPGKDPYAAYADAVIESLSQDVEGGKVVLRGDFVTNVRAWRANTAAIEKALLARVSVSQAETSAFLKAQIRVTDYVRKYMDASDWFLDSPIPPDVRAQVDGVLKNAFAELAEEMKDNLNQWDSFTLNLEETGLVEMICAFGGAVSTVGEIAQPYVEVMQTLVHGTTRIGIGFVPYAGSALDLCEAVTGKMYCLPGGKSLTDEERVGSAVGFGFGQIMKAWAGIKTVGVKPGAKIVAAGVLNLGEEFAQALRASKVDQWKGLRHAATKLPMEDFEKKAGLYLMKNEGRAMLGVGDDGVRSAIGIPKGGNGVPKGVAQAPDFLTVTKENLLALSEVKGGDMQVQVGTAVQQLTNGMKKLKELSLDGNVTRLELIMKKGAVMDNPDYGVVEGVLVKFSDGPKRIEGHVIRVIQL